MTHKSRTIMHRDYSITGTQVSVDVYDDRVETVNPGGLPKGLSREAFGTISKGGHWEVVR